MEENKKPEWLQELYEIAPPDWTILLSETDGVVSLVQQLKESLPADEVSQLGSESRRIWELFGLYYRGYHRWRDAIGIYSSMYTHFLEHQLIWPQLRLYSDRELQSRPHSEQLCAQILSSLHQTGLGRD